MGPGNYGFFPLPFLPIFLPHYSLLIGENDVNIDENRYTFFGSFFTLFINCNPRCSDPKNRRFTVRSIRFLTHVHPLSRSLLFRLVLSCPALLCTVSVLSNPAQLVLRSLIVSCPPVLTYQETVISDILTMFCSLL